MYVRDVCERAKKKNSHLARRFVWSRCACRVLGAEPLERLRLVHPAWYILPCMLKAIGPNEALLSCVHDDYLGGGLCGLVSYGIKPLYVVEVRNKKRKRGDRRGA